MEIWLPVIGFEKLYEISNWGRVRTIGRRQGAKTGYIKRQTLNSTGYRRVMLSHNQKACSRFVHHLVAAAFLPSKPPGAEIHHKDGNPLNNAASNLEWLSHRGHCERTGFGQPPVRRGTENGSAKLTPDAIRAIRADRARRKQSEIAAEYGVHQTLISLIQGRKIWRNVPDMDS